MHVKIKNINMNIYDVEKWINNTRKANGGVISPEFAMEILSKTNHFAHIKKVVKSIKSRCVDESKKLVPELVLPYKEFILSCVDGREMSPQTLEMLKELADTCGCIDEFKTINDKPKFYKKHNCEGIYLSDVKTLPENLDLSQCLEVNLEKCDLSGVKDLKFGKKEEVKLNKVMKLSEDIDLSV